MASVSGVVVVGMGLVERANAEALEEMVSRRLEETIMEMSSEICVPEAIKVNHTRDQKQE